MNVPLEAALSRLPSATTHMIASGKPDRAAVAICAALAAWIPFGFPFQTTKRSLKGGFPVYKGYPPSNNHGS